MDLILFTLHKNDNPHRGTNPTIKILKIEIAIEMALRQHVRGYERKAEKVETTIKES